MSSQNDSASSSEPEDQFIRLPTLRVKDEPQDDDTEVDVETNTEREEEYEIDPMNLLELTEERDYFEDRGGQRRRRVDDTQDGMSNSTSERPLTPSDEGWLEWLTQYPWLLMDVDDPSHFYCLYCDANVKARSSYFVVTHEGSAFHKEYAETYILFKTTEQQASVTTSTVEIKEEFGTSTSLAAIKLKRKSQSEVLLNFSWRRWTAAHPWLERIDGTLGKCRICRAKLHVEILAMRLRHEEGKNHQQAIKAKQSNKPSRRHSVPASNNLNADSCSDEDNDEPPSDSKSNAKECFRPLKDNSDMCRCKICHVTLAVSSVRKHRKTQMHIRQMLQIQKKLRYGKNIGPVKEEPISSTKDEWYTYRNEHPWLIADPKDSTQAFCKHCEKRIPFAHSVIKRRLHEHSIGHGQAVAEFKKKKLKERVRVKIKKTKSNKPNEKSKQNDDNDEDSARMGEKESVQEEDGENSSTADEGSENSSEFNAWNSMLEISRHSDEWYGMFPWCRRYTKDYMYCTYCQSKMYLTVSRRKHELSQRHRINAEQQHLSATKTPQKREFPWLVPLKANKNYIYCKYCRLRCKASNSRSKHELTERHQENEKIYLADTKKKLSTSTGKSAAKAEGPKSSTNSAPLSLRGKIKLWREKHPWLSLKRGELEPNYAYCLCCKQRVFLTSLMYVYKHERSQHHRRAWMRWDRKKPKKTSAQPNSTQNKNTETTHSNSSDEQEVEREGEEQGAEEERAAASTVQSEEDDEQRQYSWIMPDPKNKRDYGYCKYCKIRLMVSGMKKIGHEQTHKHKAAIEAFENAAKSGNETVHATTATQKAIDSPSSENQADVNNDADDDESVEVVSIKSEGSNDDTDLLEYMLRRAKESRRPRPDGYCPPKKHPKLGEESAIDIARRLTAAHEELMRLSRSLQDGSKRRDQSCISSSPESIAACLARFEQRTPKTQKVHTQTATANIQTKLVEPVQPEPVQTEPVQPEPVQSEPAQPNPVQPEPVQPGPVQPGPVQPVPVQPVPVRPEPVQPVPVRSEPAQPVPVQPGPVQPEPVQPVPVQPGPVQPGPVQPSRTLSQDNPAASCSMVAETKRDRNTFDLFFESVSETIKQLPPDLASEGRMKIMQIIYALEMRSMRRNQAADAPTFTLDGATTSKSTGGYVPRATIPKNIYTNNDNRKQIEHLQTQLQQTQLQQTQLQQKQQQQQPKQQQLSHQSHTTQPQQRQQEQQQQLQPSPALQTLQKLQATQQQQQQKNNVSIRIISGSRNGSSAQLSNGTPPPTQPPKDANSPTTQATIRRIQMNQNMQLVQRNQTAVRYIPVTQTTTSAGTECISSTSRVQTNGLSVGTNGIAAAELSLLQRTSQFKIVGCTAPQEYRKSGVNSLDKAGDGIQNPGGRL